MTLPIPMHRRIMMTVCSGVMSVHQFPVRGSGFALASIKLVFRKRADFNGSFLASVNLKKYLWLTSLVYYPACAIVLGLARSP